MLTIKILGPGCENCAKVAALAGQAVAQFGLEARVEKVTDRAEFTRYHLLSTPGLVINEKLVCAGRVPDEAEVTTWIANALEATE